MMMNGSSGIHSLVLAIALMSSGLLPLALFPLVMEGEVTRGSVLHVGEGQTYENIQDAIDDAVSGDEVYVHAGDYEENIIVDVGGITVLGEERDSTHIDGVSGNATVRITANNVTFEGFYVTGNSEDDVIRVEGNDCEIRNATVCGSVDDEADGDAGLSLWGEGHILIDVTSYGNYLGFNVRADDTSLTDCIGTNNIASGYFTMASHIEFIRCLSMNNGIAGFENFVATYISYTDCHASYNDIGFGMSDSDRIVLRNCSSDFNDGEHGWGLHLFCNVAQPMYIFDSSFIGNGKDGLYLAQETDIYVAGCTIVGNGGRGINMRERTIFGDYEFKGNLIKDNMGPGIDIGAGINFSYIVGNDIIDNNGSGAQALDDSSSIWHDGSSGNYWDDHTTPDNDGDGIVDSPYTVNGTSGSQDVYPLASRATTLPAPVLSGLGMNISAPEIVTPSLEKVVGVRRYYVGNLTAIDLDTPEDQLVWTLRSNLSSLSIIDRSVIFGYIDAAGTYWVDVTVSDGFRSDHHNYTLTVQGPPDNYDDPPIITGIHDFNCTKDVYFEEEFEVIDPDTPSTGIYIYLSSAATWLFLNGTTLYGTPTEAGTFNATISVADQLCNCSDDSVNFTIFVEEGPGSVDDPPDIIPPTDLVWYVNETVSVTLTARDTDTPQSELDWSIMTNASWLSISGTTLSGTPSGPGTFWIAATVSDENSTDSENFTLVVRSRSASENSAPVITTTDVLYAVVGYQYRVVYSAYDAEGDTLVWTIDTDATFLRLNGSTLTGSPDDQDIGNYSVSIEVTDGIESDETSFTLRVLEAPEAVDIYDIDLEFDEEYGLVTLSVSELWGAEYVDIVEIYWYIDGELVGNGTLISMELPEGSHNVTVMFRDSDGNWYTVTRTIEVGPGDDPVNVPLLWMLLAIVVLTFIVVVLVSITLYIMRKRRDIRPQVADEDWGISMDGPDIWGQRSQARWGPGKDDARVITGTISSEEDIGPLGRSTDIDDFRPAIRRGTALEREYENSMDIARSLKKWSRFGMNRGSMRRRLKRKYLEGGMDSELYEEMRTFIDENIEE